MADAPVSADTRLFEPDGRAILLADEGSGPAIVLLADDDDTIATLGALAHSVAQEDFRVVRIGSRAVATSDNAERVQDVVDVLDHLGIEDAWIGGHAAGGSVARAVAHAHHDRVNGVLLLGVEADRPALAEGLPVLVIQGAADEITPPSNGEALQASAPGLVSVVVIEDAGHAFPATHAGETAWAIEDYLDWD